MPPKPPKLKPPMLPSPLPAPPWAAPAMPLISMESMLPDHATTGRMRGCNTSVRNMFLRVSRRLRAKPLPDSKPRIKASVRDWLIWSAVFFHSSCSCFWRFSLSWAWTLRRVTSSMAAAYCRQASVPRSMPRRSSSRRRVASSRWWAFLPMSWVSNSRLSSSSARPATWRCRVCSCSCLCFCRSRSAWAALRAASCTWGCSSVRACRAWRYSSALIRPLASRFWRRAMSAW